MLSRYALVALAASLAAIPGFAQSEERQPLSLTMALERAQQIHPQLAGFVFERRLREAQSLQAAQKPGVVAELVLEDFAGSRSRSGFDGAQSTLTLSQIIEMGDKRQRRVAVSEARAAELQTEQAARQLDVVADIARRFVAALAQQHRVAVARDALALAERVQAAVGERVRAAAAPEAEMARAMAASAEAELQLEDATHTLATARFELSASIGTPEPDFDSVAGELFDLPTSTDFSGLMRQVEKSPDFLRFADEARVRDAELRLAQSQARGDLRGTLGVRRFEQDGGTALVAGISLPLFSATRAGPAIAAGEAERARVDTERATTLLRTRALLFAQHQEMEHARHVVSTLREHILVPLGKALDQTESAYRRGRYAYLEWSEAQRQLLDARLRLVDAAADFHIRRIEIERLTGASLTSVNDNTGASP